MGANTFLEKNVQLHGRCSNTNELYETRVCQRANKDTGYAYNNHDTRFKLSRNLFHL